MEYGQKPADDKLAAEAFYRIERDQNENYIKVNASGGPAVLFIKNGEEIVSFEIEAAVDRLLGYLNSICYLKMKSLITEEEFNIFEYRINKVKNSVFFKKYCENIEEKSIQPFNKSFKYLIEWRHQ